MNLCICIWMNGGLDNFTATSLTLQRGQDPVKWMFHYILCFFHVSARNNASFHSQNFDCFNCSVSQIPI